MTRVEELQAYGARSEADKAPEHILNSKHHGRVVATTDYRHLYIISPSADESV